MTTGTSRSVAPSLLVRAVDGVHSPPPLGHPRVVRPRPLDRRGIAIPDQPTLVPGLACLTRDDRTLQLGVEPPHALVLYGAGAAHARVLRSLDGSRDRLALHRLAAGSDLTVAELDHLLELLVAHDLLVSATGGARLETAADDLARMSPDLTALALRHAHSPEGGRERARTVLARRAASWVEVYGAGRVGAGVAAVVAAAGVGRVSVVDERRCEHADTAPLAPSRALVGSTREVAARAGVAERSAARTTPAPAPRVPDLCVLAPDGGPSAALAATWARRSEPHVLAYVRETVGVVGPLVVPGRTTCLRCLDLHRRDHDPQWPRVAAQLADGLAVRACDVGLATLVAAQCALQVAAFLDRDDVSAVAATLETRAPDGLTRRRAWPPHPACGCLWSATLQTEPQDEPTSP